MSWSAFGAHSKMVSWTGFRCLNPLCIVECFRPFDRLRDLVYTLLFTALCDDFTQSYCARRRESRASSLAHDRAEKQAAAGCNPLYVVECFRSVASPGPYKSRVPEGVFLPDFLGTTSKSTFSEGFFSNSLIFNEVA